MLQYLLVDLDELLADDSEFVARPAQEGSAQSTAGDTAADPDAPLFSLLYAQLGLPGDAGQWRAAAGRHAGPVTYDGPSPLTVSSPTIDLLERALVGLRAWDTSRARSAQSAQSAQSVRAVR